MSEKIKFPYDKNRQCDGCDNIGAFDWNGDYLCKQCCDSVIHEAKQIERTNKEMDGDKKLPYVFATTEGLIRCPYCLGIHRHGGRGNGIAEGQRFADCALGEYIVIPHGMTVNYKKR